MNPPPEPTAASPEGTSTPDVATGHGIAGAAPRMETVLEATERLNSMGYTMDFVATEDGWLRCGACKAEHDPANVVIDEVVRYEGASNPDDETMLLALRCECGYKGLYVTAFGPNASNADIALLKGLP